MKVKLCRKFLLLNQTGEKIEKINKVEMKILPEG